MDENTSEAQPALGPESEWEFTHHYRIEGLTVGVNKVGGGTVGREYVGGWRIRVREDGDEGVHRTVSFWTGMPHTHRWVADCMADAWVSSVETV